MAGTGKTTLASTVVGIPDVKDWFSGGIYWASVGEIKTDDELAGLLRMLAENLLGYLHSNSCIAPVLYTKLTHKIYPLFGMLELDDSLRLIREVLDTATASSSHVLVVLDDIWSDRLVRLLCDLKIVILITSRYPELFSEGQFPGCVVRMEECSEEQAMQALYRHSYLTPSLTSLPLEARSLMNTCCTLLEVDTMSRLVAPLMSQRYQLKALLDRRMKDLRPSAPHMRWVSRHNSAPWAPFDLIRHIGCFAALDMTFDCLDDISKRNYLLLSVLPAGATLSISLLHLVWCPLTKAELHSQIEIFVARNLLTSSGEGVDRECKLHVLHELFITMTVLRHREAIAPSIFCSLFSNSEDSCKPVEHIERHIQAVAERLVCYLSDKHMLLSTPAYMYHNFQVFWRKLKSAHAARVLDRFESPVDRFHQVMESSFLKEDQVDYVYSSCLVLGQLDVEDTQLEQWLSRTLTIFSGNCAVSKAVDPCKRAVVLNMLGVLYGKQGRLDEALELHIEALESFQSTRHPSGSSLHNEMGRTFLSIADIYSTKGSFDESAHIVKSLIRYKNLYGCNFSELASLWLRLGQYLEKQGLYVEAKDAFTTASSFYASAMGSSHPDVILSCALAATMQIRVGDEAAIKDVKNALELLNRQNCISKDKRLRMIYGALPEELFSTVGYEADKPQPGALCGLVTCVSFDGAAEHKS
eukprot:CAMPEP_0185028484 /NCGR_PEP_ID=MMETSP1103-20130426/14224_1 /TAXON_ID=36769 /ORGANISM="Paraphysomonas bandaiensis, Strain Caron Lab Isolate" /LENGTH=696 /DNA_ID=CAMNT_0027562911 /DNA_START=246 /DNA_END=2336 /DNA_ORIENTATION=-